MEVEIGNGCGNTTMNADASRTKRGTRGGTVAHMDMYAYIYIYTYISTHIYVLNKLRCIYIIYALNIIQSYNTHVTTCVYTCSIYTKTLLCCWTYQCNSHQPVHDAMLDLIGVTLLRVNHVTTSSCGLKGNMS